MCSCLLSLLDFHQQKTGKETKAIVWAHNSHIGAARASERKQTIQELELMYILHFLLAARKYVFCLVPLKTVSEVQMEKLAWSSN